MGAPLTFELGIKWAEMEPDGQKCGKCGDPIFLRGFEAIVFIDGKEIARPEDWKLCQSCNEAMNGG